MRTEVESRVEVEAEWSLKAEFCGEVDSEAERRRRQSDRAWEEVVIGRMKRKRTSMGASALTYDWTENVVGWQWGGAENLRTRMRAGIKEVEG